MTKDNQKANKKPNQTLTNLLKYMQVYIVEPEGIKQVTPENFEEELQKQQNKNKPKAKN